ncbi:MAG TPA: hypothetical protein VG496_19980 [Myxococcales bacterium]|nr:hypothetical protein [Myxococcales bacterium]
MKKAFSIAIVALLSACAGVSSRPSRDMAPEGRWEGFLVSNGMRQPLSVELSESSDIWDGRLKAGDNSVALESVRVTGNNVHFESAGAGTFDGAVAGDSMAGSVSGPVNGSFSLTHVDSAWNPYPFGP